MHVAPVIGGVNHVAGMHSCVFVWYVGMRQARGASSPDHEHPRVAQRNRHGRYEIAKRPIPGLARGSLHEGMMKGLRMMRSLGDDARAENPTLGDSPTSEGTLGCAGLPPPSVR